MECKWKDVLYQLVYSNVVVHEQGEDSLLERRRIILKCQIRFNIEMEDRGILPEDKHPFNKWCSVLWNLPVKDKKL